MLIVTCCFQPLLSITLFDAGIYECEDDCRFYMFSAKFEKPMRITSLNFRRFLGLGKRMTLVTVIPYLHIENNFIHRE